MSDQEGQPGREDEARQEEERPSKQILKKLPLTDEDVEITIKVRRPRSQILRDAVPKSSVGDARLVIYGDMDPDDTWYVGDSDMGAVVIPCTPFDLRRHKTRFEIELRDETSNESTGREF